ncbi:unnamed protein product, partial [Callosobruchus maculatus]
LVPYFTELLIDNLAGATTQSGCSALWVAASVLNTTQATMDEGYDDNEQPVNKEEAVRTEDNGTDGRLQFKEIEIEELDDTEDSKVEDDLSQIEAQVIETDDNDEDVEDGKQEVNSRSVEDDIEIEELETEEPIYEADETEDEVHHGSAFIIGKFYS